jgi:beta-aspartyl-peptidase (threonine type)
MRPSLIVHGGAWNIPDAAVADCRTGCLDALAAGWATLSRGGRALDAVESAIRVLEDHPVFDAGTGSHLNRDGHVELDAMIMDGATLNAGAVAGVRGVRNPITLARGVLETGEHMMLVGEGARQFAVEHDLPLCDPSELIVERERAAWLAWRDTPDAGLADFATGSAMGTVGAVAVDNTGGIVAGTSTGGTLCKHPGRVGDSSLIGCGCYADREAGAVSCTGLGEAIMRVVLAKTAVEYLRAGLTPDETARRSVDYLLQRGRGNGGLIILGADGTPGLAFNTTRMAYAYVAADGAFVVGTDHGDA